MKYLFTRMMSGLDNLGKNRKFFVFSCELFLFSVIVRLVHIFYPTFYVFQIFNLS
jgi:hypothetical protein